MGPRVAAVAVAAAVAAVLLASGVNAVALTQCQVVGLAKLAGIPRADIPKMVCIAYYESNWDTDKTHRNKDASTDYGLWQVRLPLYRSLYRYGAYRYMAPGHATHAALYRYRYTHVHAHARSQFRRRLITTTGAPPPASRAGATGAVWRAPRCWRYVLHPPRTPPQQKV